MIKEDNNNKKGIREGEILLLIIKPNLAIPN
jgi:hypothetical protein